MLNAGRVADPSALDYWPGSHSDGGPDGVYANCSTESETGAKRRFGVVNVQVLSVTAEAADEMALTTTRPARTATAMQRTIKVSPAGKSSREKDEPLVLTQIQVDFWPEDATTPPQPRLFYKLLQDVRQILRKLPNQEVGDLIAH